MRLTILTCIAALSFLLSSCDFVQQAYKETFNQQDNSATGDKEAGTNSGPSRYADETESESIPEKINLFEAGEELDAIQQQLQDMFPGKSLKVFPPHIYFQPERIRLQLVDPEIPENVDWYYYEAETGEWSKEEPIKISSTIHVEPMALDEVKFSTLTPVYKQILEKSKTVEGAEVPTAIYFSFHVKEWNWNTRIYGSRADYDFRADIDGNELSFERT